MQWLWYQKRGNFWEKYHRTRADWILSMGEKGDMKRILRFQVWQVMIPLARTRKTGREADVQGMEEPEASTVVPSFEKPALAVLRGTKLRQQPGVAILVQVRSEERQLYMCPHESSQHFPSSQDCRTLIEV